MDQQRCGEAAGKCALPRFDVRTQDRQPLQEDHPSGSPGPTHSPVLGGPHEGAAARTRPGREALPLPRRWSSRPDARRLSSRARREREHVSDVVRCSGLPGARRLDRLRARRAMITHECDACHRRFKLDVDVDPVECEDCHELLWRDESLGRSSYYQLRRDALASAGWPSSRRGTEANQSRGRARNLEQIRRYPNLRREHPPEVSVCRRCWRARDSDKGGSESRARGGRDWRRRHRSRSTACYARGQAGRDTFGHVGHEIDDTSH